jgi:hypothetical protein
MNMDSLNLVKLSPLMKLTRGRTEVVIGLIDGSVVMQHPELADANIREVSGGLSGQCVQANSTACIHGTFINSPDRFTTTICQIWTKSDSSRKVQVSTKYRKNRRMKDIIQTLLTKAGHLANPSASF